MGQQFIRTDTLSTEGWRAKYRFHYVEKYYNKWMNHYKFPELNYQQTNYIMKHFWADGTVSAGNLACGCGYPGSCIRAQGLPVLLWLRAASAGY